MQYQFKNQTNLANNLPLGLLTNQARFVFDLIQIELKLEFHLDGSI